MRGRVSSPALRITGTDTPMRTQHAASFCLLPSRACKAASFLLARQGVTARGCPAAFLPSVAQMGTEAKLQAQPPCLHRFPRRTELHKHTFPQSPAQPQRHRAETSPRSRLSVPHPPQIGRALETG